jgi:branched-chain amino acid transport system substrate-binding protein
VTVYHQALARRAGVLLAAAIGLFVVAGCGSSSSSSTASSAASSSASTSATTSSSSSASASTSSCGTKPGVAATGTPIPVGSINVKQSGTDFSDIGNMAAAYFACINANGGINGHPIKLYEEFEQSSPSQIAAEAKQLVDTDHVVAMTATSSIIECSVNYKYWQSIGYKVIAAGIAPECYGTPNYADVNMGARYSSDGAVQYMLAHGVKKVIFDQSNVPGTAYNIGGSQAIAKAYNVPITGYLDTVPISDANSVAIRDVDAAGPDGGIELTFTPPEALVILQAAQKLHLQDRVKMWSCATPCNTDFLAKALGSAWNGKLFVNAELSPPDTTTTANMNLYKGILKQYGSNVSGGIGSFSQMGYTSAEILAHALESMKPPYTAKTVNAAIEGVKNYDTGQLCQQWTYGSYPEHVANNMDYTVTPNNGQMVLAPGGGCALISPSDPLIAQYRSAAGTAPLAAGQPQGNWGGSK